MVKPAVQPDDDSRPQFSEKLLPVAELVLRIRKNFELQKMLRSDRTVSKRCIEAKAACVHDEILACGILGPNPNLLRQVCAAIGDIDQIFSWLQFERGPWVAHRCHKMVRAIVCRMPFEDAPDDVGHHWCASFAQIRRERYGCRRPRCGWYRPRLRFLGLAACLHRGFGTFALDRNIFTVDHRRRAFRRFRRRMRCNR